MMRETTESLSNGQAPVIEPFKFRRPIIIQASNKLQSHGMLLGKHYNKTQRLKRAALLWVLLWLLAVPAVFVPIIHFILTPALLLAGPILGYMRFRQETVIESVEGECPYCHASFQLVLDAHTVLPHWENCPACDKHIRLQQEDKHE